MGSKTQKVKEGSGTTAKGADALLSANAVPVIHRDAARVSKIVVIARIKISSSLSEHSPLKNSYYISNNYRPIYPCKRTLALRNICCLAIMHGLQQPDNFTQKLWSKIRNCRNDHFDFARELLAKLFLQRSAMTFDVRNIHFRRR